MIFKAYPHLREQWQQRKWTFWLVWWSLQVVGAVLVLNTLVQIVVHWRDWGRLGLFGWLVNIGMLLLGTVIMLGAAHFIALNWTEVSRLEQMDWLVIWGVTAVGVCLLLGFLTRTACLGGAVLLLLFVLPAWPETLAGAGQFTKNIVEMLALLALATTRSGRWLGVDGSLQFLSPWRWVPAEAALCCGATHRAVRSLFLTWNLWKKRP